NGPPLIGKRVSLRTIVPQDYDFLYELSTSSELGFRWRHRGTTPSPESFVQNLWHGVLAQFVIETTGGGDPIGYITSFDANFRNRTAQLAMLLVPELLGKGWTLEAAILFINYLFE